MIAIFKREFKSYFTSPIGYVVIAFFMCFVGLYFTIYNLNSQSPMFGQSLSYTAFILIIIVPILSMRIMAEEKKQKTDQLLYTAPVRITDIVLGKYLALIAVFGIPMLIFCLYPVILLNLGKTPESMAMDYVGILGYFLLGAACLAVGFFISTITESQVLAAVVTFAVLLLSYYSSVLASLIPGTAKASAITVGLIILVLSAIFYLMTKNIIIASAFCVLAEIILFIIYFVKGELLEGFANDVIGVLDLTQRINNFPLGQLDFTIVIYYLSVVFLFLFLSVQAIYKRRWS